jgi:hypothetical protein
VPRPVGSGPRLAERVRGFLTRSSFSRVAKPTPPRPGRCGPAGGGIDAIGKGTPAARCEKQRKGAEPQDGWITTPPPWRVLLDLSAAGSTPGTAVLRAPFPSLLCGALTGSDALALLAVLFRRCCRRGCSSRVQAAPASGWQAGRARGRGGANFQRGRGRVWRDLEGTEGSDLHHHWTGFHVQLP